MIRSLRFEGADYVSGPGGRCCDAGEEIELSRLLEMSTNAKQTMGIAEELAACFGAVATRRKVEHLGEWREGRVGLKDELGGVSEKGDEGTEKADPAMDGGRCARGAIGVVKCGSLVDLGGGSVGGVFIEEKTLAGRDDVLEKVAFVRQCEVGKDCGAAAAEAASYAHDEGSNPLDSVSKDEPEFASAELVDAKSARFLTSGAARREECGGIIDKLDFVGLDPGEHGGSLHAQFVGSRRTSARTRKSVGSSSRSRDTAKRLRGLWCSME